MKRIVAGIAGAVLLTSVAWAADGQAVFEKKCMPCHSVGGKGGPMAKVGGPLDGIGSKRDDAWLHAYLKDPKSKVPDAKMPALKLTDDEWNAVVEYLGSLKGPAPK